MDVVKLPKKVRMVCYEIMDGKEEALDTLESFADKYPHQVAAVKAEVAYFNLDYEKALALDLAILPWLEEWYYSNVSDEHMIAMTVAAIRLHREQEMIEALTKGALCPLRTTTRTTPTMNQRNRRQRSSSGQSWWNRIRNSRQTIPMPGGSSITTAVCSEPPGMP